MPIAARRREDHREVLHAPDHRGGEARGAGSAGRTRSPSGSPRTPARRIMPIVAMRVAITHARLCTRPTFTPSSEARSALLALARMRDRPCSCSAGTRTASTVTASVVITAIELARVEDERAGCRSGSRTAAAGSAAGTTASKKLGIASPMPASSWARPIVATIRIRRGARANRRITTNSTAEPERDGDRRARAAPRPSTTSRAARRARRTGSRAPRRGRPARS